MIYRAYTSSGLNKISMEHAMYYASKVIGYLQANKILAF